MKNETLHTNELKSDLSSPKFQSEDKSELDVQFDPEFTKRFFEYSVKKHSSRILGE